MKWVPCILAQPILVPKSTLLTYMHRWLTWSKAKEDLVRIFFNLAKISGDYLQIYLLLKKFVWVDYISIYIYFGRIWWGRYWLLWEWIFGSGVFMQPKFNRVCRPIKICVLGFNTSNWEDLQQRLQGLSFYHRRYNWRLNCGLVIKRKSQCLIMLWAFKVIESINCLVYFIF